MEVDHPILGWNAHRHASSPIAQPKYRFQDVPKCRKSLEGSVIQEVTTREAFKEIMGEMVLLCNEAMKRSRAGRTASKPLSLEYIADRLDVDDPCFGYIIRSEEGHLQGFITVTTFTNWQKNFKWDSLNEVSFYYDDDAHHLGNHSSGGDGGQVEPSPGRKKRMSHKTLMKGSQKRIVDEDGSLAKELQKTVRLGDPYNEGIVWPRIAEISLLGALGCGKALVELVIEQLEFQRASGTANYDFVALQATDNSIPFYESRGFVRVGAVTYESNDEEMTGENRSISPAFSTDSTASETNSSSSSSAAAEAVTPKCPEKVEAIPMSQTIVSSPHFVHEVVKPGQTPSDIAKLFKVSVWDIIFLNKDIYKDLRPTSRLIKGTLLNVPEPMEEDNEAANNYGSKAPDSPTKWYVAKENDTPRQIAKRFGLACNTLVSANRRRLPELQATSRLKAGTRLKVSNLNQQDEICQPYCHWSFPEDTAVEGGEPSYMMVYKLDRKTARNPRTVRNSFAVPVSQHSPPRLLFPPPPKTTVKSSSIEEVPKTGSPRQLVSRGHKPAPAPLKLPKQPSRPAELKKTPPQSGQDVYWDHQKELHPELAKPTPENEKIIKDRWSRLGGYKKDRYHTIAAEARKIYDQVEKDYMAEVAQWKKVCKKIQDEHEQSEELKQAEAAAKQMAERQSTLYNKVVKLRDDALEGKEFQYWFVLTYIPDLKWCHLAPMFQDGHFGADRKKAYGRPRYRLVDEKYGKELDISSAYCIPVRSRALKRTVDADKEEWDIQDGPVKLVKEGSDTDVMDTLSVSTALSSSKKRLTKQPKFRARSAIKPITGKISVGSALRHSQDPLKRTRSSPVGASRKRSYDEVAVEEVHTPMKERNRRRCMRCVDFGAPHSQAVSCLGAKGRFGRDACEYYDASGAPTDKLSKLTVPGSGRKPRRCCRCIEFGAPDEQASRCPGAKGRFGRSACSFFSASGERIVPSDIESEDGRLTEPPVKLQRTESITIATTFPTDKEVDVLLTPGRKAHPSHRPVVSDRRQ
ncbi:lysM domain containing protein [Nitzschia inconspicua]|uniref:LysM domain containing protein n=1 Tax=Nitzschia inconspicua TaxID=303405 RepID=A0A9K3KW54_9STRA|nr:lysM domain containing protein [Nitzschia inconspicua]